MNTLSIKFLDLIFNKTLSQKCHIKQLVTKLISACYADRTINNGVYFSYTHSVATYNLLG
jgi:hypothetical protein